MPSGLWSSSSCPLWRGHKVSTVNIFIGRPPSPLDYCKAKRMTKERQAGQLNSGDLRFVQLGVEPMRISALSVMAPSRRSSQRREFWNSPHCSSFWTGLLSKVCFHLRGGAGDWTFTAFRPGSIHQSVNPPDQVFQSSNTKHGMLTWPIPCKRLNL